MYIRVLCTIIYQSDDLALSASDSIYFNKFNSCGDSSNCWIPYNQYLFSLDDRFSISIMKPTNFYASRYFLSKKKAMPPNNVFSNIVSASPSNPLRAFRCILDAIRNIIDVSPKTHQLPKDDFPCPVPRASNIASNGAYVS